MDGLSNQEILFVGTAFLFQIALIIHFALRKWFFAGYIKQYGWGMYALSLPAVLVSLIMLAGRMDWGFWLGGFIFLVWAVFGYIIEYRLSIQWRNPIRWQFFGPYVFLYIATVMFYWWPLAQINKALWYACALLFIAGTFLNVISHQGPQEGARPE